VSKRIKTGSAHGCVRAAEPEMPRSRIREPQDRRGIGQVFCQRVRKVEHLMELGISAVRMLACEIVVNGPARRHV